MTGNTKVWRAPLAGLASFAMIATMGLAAGTANAAFEPADNSEHTVTVNANGGKISNALVAKFTALQATDSNVKITYNVDNDASKSDVATLENVNANTELVDITGDADTTKPEAPDSNYNFTGWYDQAAIGGTRVQDKTSGAKVTGDVDLYAHYASGPAADNTISVNFNGFSTPVKIAAGDKVASWQTPQSAVDSKNQVSVWTTKLNDKSTAVDFSKQTFTNTTTLYPVYEAVTITYKKHADNSTIKTEYAPKGVKITESSDAAVKTEGANGWYELKDGETSYKDDSSLKSTAFDFAKGSDTDVTLYGKATAVTKYTVTYYYPSAKDDNSGYGTATKYGEDKDVIEGTQVTLPANPTDNTKLGRPFLYWSETLPTAANTDPAQFNTSAYIEENKDLYAVFGDATKGTAKVTFDENYNGKRTTVTVDASNSVTAPTPGEREGYEFKGWASNANATAADYEAEETISGITRDASFYAVWVENDSLASVKTKLSNAKTVVNEEGEKVRPYEEKSYAAYLKVYNKYFDNASGLKDPSKKDEAIKAVSEAKAAIVETLTWNLYRVYNPGNGDHYFVADKDIQSNLVHQGWKAEGAPFKVVGTNRRTAESSDDQAALGTAIFSVYNGNTGEHLLVQEFEADALAKAGWVKEQIQFYVPQGATKDVYRVYNPNTNGPAHVYVSKGEGAGLVAQGWRWDFGGKVAFKLS